MKIRSFFVIFLIFALFSCKDGGNSPEISFYYWKTDLKFSQNQKSALDDLHVKKLYVRFFDVNYSEQQKQAIPLSPIVFSEKFNSDLEIIPVIFITNKTFYNISLNESKKLGENILKKIESIAKEKQLKINEIQLDCDWTKQTKEKFFSMIKSMKSKSKYTFSATIRLHQYRNFELTSVPPVEKGTLMFYNIGNIHGNDSENSILSEKLTEKYLKNAQKYPLKLKVALPIYSWAVVMRDGKVVHLLNDIYPNDLSKNFKEKSENEFICTKTHYFNSALIYKDDKMRLELISPKLLRSTAKILAKNMSLNDSEVIFYHLSDENLKAHPTKELQEIANLIE